MLLYFSKEYSSSTAQTGIDEVQLGSMLSSNEFRTF